MSTAVAVRETQVNGNTANMVNTANAGVWVSSQPVNVTLVKRFAYDMPAVSVEFVSDSTPGKVYRVTQHAHSHSVTVVQAGDNGDAQCWFANYMYSRKLQADGSMKGMYWQFLNTGVYKTWKPVQELIDAGVLMTPPAMQVARVEEFYETPRVADLQLINGRYYAPVSVAGDMLIEMRYVRSGMNWSL